MKNRTLSLFLALFLILCGIQNILAQAGVPIALNEYCVSNSGNANAEFDNINGNRSDWLELYSTFTSPVNLQSYYLSNDKTNLFKWKFPTNYIILPNQYRTIWLSGKNVATAGGVHTNFTMDQCKNQWLILSNSNGVVVDSVFVRRTKEGHSRGRVDYSYSGASAWKIQTITSLGGPNSGPSYYDYAPKPIIRLATAPLATNPVTTNVGGFYPLDGEQQFYIYMENGVPYDSLNYDCFRMYYTLNTGEYPVPGAPGTFQVMDTMPIISNGFAHLIRAISVPKNYPATPPAVSPCQTDFLPSFCETNTYFTDPAYQEFSPDFGVVSLSMGQDSAWLNTSGATSPTIHVEYYDNKQQLTEGYANVTRPVNEQWLTKQKGFHITIDDRKGFGCNFEGKIFNVDSLGSSNRMVFPTLHLKAGDYESNSVPLNSITGLSSGTGMMDLFYQSLAAKNNLNVSPLHVKPVVVFMNGKYWGAYDLREVYDKHYENYYNQQSKDSLTMQFYHGQDGVVSYADGPSSNFATMAVFKADVYDLAMSPTIGSLVNYNKLFSRLDKASFIDYMILNSYAMNNNLWNYDIAFAKGGQTGLPGDKWHYYLWNMPSIFNFTALSINTGPLFTDANVSPCFVHTSSITPSTFAGNGHRNMLFSLMNPPQTNLTNGKGLFQMEYKARYQDLLNGPLKCENILKHYDYVTRVFRKEMKYHEDPASPPLAGNFVTQPDSWDTLVTIYRRGIEKRCKTMQDGFGPKFGCYNMQGPYPLTVDVKPAGAGIVKLNSLTLDTYVWSGQYYRSELAFKAIATGTNYVFHHWEFKNHTPLNDAPISLDSVRISFMGSDDVVAVFTDKLNDIEMPTGFSPNGDNNNDVFRPLGSALYTRDFDMSIWNRWGQEIYRSTDPSKGWDGTSRGQDAQTGVYAYVITYKNIYNESKILKGNLTLLR